MTNLAVIESHTPAPVRSLDSWLAGQLSGNTRRTYANCIRQFMEFAGHDLALVTREQVYEYRALLVSKYAPKTVNLHLSAIRQMFTEAVRHGMIDRSPADGVKGHKATGPRVRTSCPSVEQVRAMLTSIPDTPQGIRDRAMLSLMVNMGLRREEVVNLTGSSVVTDSGITCLDITGKGEKTRREPIPASALTALRQWFDLAGIGPDVPIFREVRMNGAVHVGDRRLSTEAVYRIVGKYMDRVGIEGSPHSLRHFYITEMVRRGASIDRVQRAAGHADIKTTQQYIHADQDLRDSAANYMDF